MSESQNENENAKDEAPGCPEIEGVQVTLRDATGHLFLATHAADGLDEKDTKFSVDTSLGGSIVLSIKADDGTSRQYLVGISDVARAALEHYYRTIGAEEHRGASEAEPGVAEPMRVYVVSSRSECCESWHLESVHRTMEGAQRSAAQIRAAKDAEDMSPDKVKWTFEDTSKHLVQTWTRDALGVLIESPTLEA